MRRGLREKGCEEGMRRGLWEKDAGWWGVG